MRRRIPVLWAAVWLGLTGHPSHARAAAAGSMQSEERAVLSVEQAAQQALENHPSVGALRAGSEEARAAAGEAAAGWYPALRLSGSATRYEEPYAVFPIHGFNPKQIPPFDRTIYQGALSLSYTLFDGGGRPARVRQARSRVSAARESLLGAEQSLVARVLMTYLDVLARAKVLDAQDRRIAALESEQTRVRQLMEVGRAARLDDLRVDAELSAAAAERVRLAAELDSSERDLSQLTGRALDDVRADRLIGIGVADTSIAPREALLDRAMHASPGALQARSQLAAARAGGRGARSSRWPEVKLLGNYTGWADSRGDDTAEWSAAAQVSLALFSGGAIDYGIRRADAAARGAAEEVRLAEMQIEQNLDSALNGVLEARARVASLAKAVESTGEVVRIEKLALENGSGTQSDYLDGEAGLFAARAGLIEARYREIAARAELARVTGDLDLAWLTQNLEEER
jgi:outer membrane protein